ncbi:lactonase family protein [Specibacter sp. AOP5-B1-6]|uniref:lactonase family protein n=1 Tax=Specibacter sp. AOP5-B1-6 TaxID=3457653 RepID=UPI00402B0F76
MTSSPDTNAPAILVSGYTEEGYGSGPGIVRFELFRDGAVGERRRQSTGVLNPSFMAWGDGTLLAVEELPQGNIVALDPQTLELLGTVSTGGADSCHVVLIDEEVWGANYSSGNVSVVPLAELLRANGPGTATPPQLLSHPGSGPVADRQGESHAHQVTATPWGTALVADLGADRVDEYALADGGFASLGSAQLPPGTGPRHVAIKGDFLLVAGELDGYLHVLQRTPRDAQAHDAQVPGAGNQARGADDFWRWLFKSPLAESPEAVAGAKEFHPSHIELSADGSKLYAAVRGANTIVVLDVGGLNEHDGTIQSPAAPTAPRFLHEVSSGGNWPRHFVLSAPKDGYNKIYVANQLSNNVAVFDLDDNGLPGSEPVQSVEFGSPVCILLR